VALPSPRTPGQGQAVKRQEGPESSTPGHSASPRRQEGLLGRTVGKGEDCCGYREHRTQRVERAGSRSGVGLGAEGAHRACSGTGRTAAQPQASCWLFKDSLLV
uniref:Uncharacterized protein n=1 Tax=Macaca nemestrina TaxID=9545 RepID=A0A2K6DYQ1_MACNE